MRKGGRDVALCVLPRARTTRYLPRILTRMLTVTNVTGGHYGGGGGERGIDVVRWCGDERRSMANIPPLSCTVPPLT